MEASRSTQRLDSPLLAERKETIRADISRRLRSVCAHLSDEEFARLVETMVERKLKGERRGSI